MTPPIAPTTNQHVFLATLGQRPQALTIALDILRERYPITSVGVIHTDPVASGIAEALHDLNRILAHDYSELSLKWHEIFQSNSRPLIDIVDPKTAQAYYRGIVGVLRAYHDRGETIHLLISGGRKAMSVYATLAAAVAGGPDDHVWTIISPESLLNAVGEFHASPEYRSQIHLIDLPIVHAGHIPGVEETGLIDEEGIPLLRRDHVRQQMLAQFSPEEERLALLLEQYPYDSNEQIAKRLIKSSRTIENQLHSIYGKMGAFLTSLSNTPSFLIERPLQRQILLDILQRRFSLE